MIKNCTITSQSRTYKGKIDTDTGKIIIQEDSVLPIIFRLEDNPGLEVECENIFNRDRVENFIRMLENDEDKMENFFGQLGRSMYCLLPEGKSDSNCRDTQVSCCHCLKKYLLVGEG